MTEETLQKAKDRLQTIYSHLETLNNLTAFTYYGAGFLDGHSPFLNYDEMKELGRFFYELIEKWNTDKKENED